MNIREIRVIRVQEFCYVDGSGCSLDCVWQGFRMIRQLVFFLGLFLLVSQASSTTAAERVFLEQEIAGARLYYEGEIPIAVFSGTPEEMGRQQAELLAKSSQPVMVFPRQFMAEYGVDHFWPLATAAAKTLMMNAPEHHQRELKAAAEHADFDAGILDVANTLLELRRLGCSTIVVDAKITDSGKPLFGRNFDFPTLGILNKYSLLAVYLPEQGRSFASVGFPGLGGVFSGMNDAGLAVATLDVYRAGDGSKKYAPDGEPLGFVFRRILEECSTVDEAEELLSKVKATTWMNLTVCDTKQGAVFEITPKQIIRRNATLDDMVLPATNHFRTEQLSVGERCWRIPRLMKLGKQQGVTVADVHSHLQQVSFKELTLQTMVFEPDSRVIHLSIGEVPSASGELTRIELGPLFQ